MTTTPRVHDPTTLQVGDAWSPRCSCGWRGKTYEVKQSAALTVAQQHATSTIKAEAAKGCGKTRFPSKAAAEQAVLDAKIAKGLRGNDRRREQRAYRCSTCPAGPWHLTSRPGRSSVPGGRL